MKITIRYKLYTDGDYCLKNSDDFGCTDKNVVVNDLGYPEYYDYIGTIEIENKEEISCKSEAKIFLWKFLCDGIYVSYTHPWLLKDFYNIMESLEECINGFKEGVLVTKKHLSGNYDGTEIEVIIADDNNSGIL